MKFLVDQKMKKSLLLLGLITLLAAFCRFWRLSSHPVSLSMNEVAIAYNSYSILKTGRDEWGELLPLAFRSVGDYKAPILIYLMMPALAVMGLNEFSARFTVALIGTLTVPVVYFLVSKIIKRDKVALLTALSLAISPWHIQFSRATFEAIVALFFVVLGALTFFVSLERKGRYWWMSAIFFALSMYSYHAERVFTPLYVLGLLVIYRKQIIENRRKALAAFGIGLIALTPFFRIMFSSQGQIRARVTFINNDLDLRLKLQESLASETFLPGLLNHPLLITFNFWAKRYLNYFDPGFIFFKGSQFTLPNAPDVGLLHLIEMPLFALGLWQFFFKKVLDRKTYQLVIFWLLWGPVVASLTNNEQHALRSLVWIPIPQLLVALGAYYCVDKVASLNRLKRAIVFSGSAIAVLFSLVYFFNIYTVHFPISFSECWDYGWKEAVLFTWKHQQEYREIVVDPSFGSEGPYTMGVPYLHFLFYGHYPPHLFQNDPARKKGWDSVDFANFTFRPIYWPKDRGSKGSLFIGSPWSLPKEELGEAIVHREIKFKNGATAFLIVEPK